VGRVPSFDPQTRKGPWLNTLAWAARQRPVTWFLVNVGNKIDPHLMRATGGRVRSSLSAPTVLLTHTGAKSGRKRSTPLGYFTDGDDVVLIASRGGSVHHPAWYHNATANPEVELWTKGGGGHYRAREAEGPPSGSGSGTSPPASIRASRATRSGRAGGSFRWSSAPRRTTDPALAFASPGGVAESG
jgi:F420H(2)-dependent quinone reductase